MTSSLYVHIPFCTQKCGYCDFFSVPLASGDNKCVPDINFVKALISETAYHVRKYQIEKWNTIYIGGGTPGLLSPELLSVLVAGLKSLVKDSAVNEITVELNPDNVTHELLLSALSCGVTRISMGIQALDDKVLKACGRKCKCESIFCALELLKKEWKGRLSVDFIAGLPLQTEESFEKQFKVIFDYPVDHISLYALTLEVNTPLYRQITSGQLEWDSELSDDLWLIGREILKNNGFYQYEVSNFSKKGFESLHNQTYWNLESYIGTGPGASGTVYSGQTVRWDNNRNIAEYENFWLKNAENLSLTDESVDKIRHIEIIDKKTEQFEYLMMGFRMLKGLSSQKYYNRFNESLEKRIGVTDGVFNDWKRRGLAVSYESSGETYYALNYEGLLLLNRFLESLL
jgi:oxygen-independent coproporphyrinogen-3 oxidase